jgi:2-iminobutanoate/2-iminopropanoate deaminase
MSRKTIYTEDAPAAPLNASQAVVCNGMVHCSGSLALEGKTMQIIPGGIQAETVNICTMKRSTPANYIASASGT